MATAKTETLLSLDDFAAILGIHPLHFNQVAINGKVGGCGSVWAQYDWQAGTALSRESIAQAIKSAEDDLEEYLGFPVAPKYYVGREVPLKKFLIVTLPKAYYLQGGIKARVKLGQASVSYDDLDEDGYAETGSTSIAFTGNPSEIEIYYPDKLDGWKIQTSSVEIVSDSVFITFRRERAVIPTLLEGQSIATVEGTEDENFLDAVDVYHTYTDESQQGILKAISHSCGCLNISGCHSCLYSEQTTCIRGENAKNGIVELTPANWVTDHWEHVHCQHHPFQGLLNFKAGWTYDDIWKTPIAYLALTKVPDALCSCPHVQRKFAWWTEDASMSNRERSFKIPDKYKSSEFGWTRAAMYAYSVANKHRMAQGG